VDSDKKKLFELYVFIKPFKIKEIQKILNLKEEEIKVLVTKINQELKDRPYKIYLDDELIYFGPREEYIDTVKDYVNPILEKKELKVLSMIVNNFSYSDIIKKFGKKGSEILKKLENDGWIKIKKEGKKYKFLLTSKFKKYFSIE
jgi:chromosome segregation and condensation protein ScpB